MFRIINKKKILIFVAKLTRMKRSYIWEQNEWPYLTWDNKELSPLLGEVRNKQGRLTGMVSLLGDELKKDALHRIVVSEIMSSARIEGETLDEEQVVLTTGRYLVENEFHLSETGDVAIGASQVLIDALYNYDHPVLAERLFLWKYALEGKTGFSRSFLDWHERDSLWGLTMPKPAERKMEFLTIPIPVNTSEEMKMFFRWVNTIHPTDPVIKAGVAYLRFLLIRPFDNDNGRIARNIAVIFLSRAGNLPDSFFSISTQIARDLKQYEEILTHTLTGSMDITEWLRWFLYCLWDALSDTEAALAHVISKAKFFDKYRLLSLNDRQLHTLNMLWDGFDSKLTSSFYASMNKCSPDTALRDIQDLITKNILQKEDAGGRSTAYKLGIKN